MTDLIDATCRAKVNLFLRVLAREADGYHGIETLFCRIALADTLRVERTASGIALEVTGADVGPVEQNLAWRAADAVLAATGRRFGVAMQLTKRIPAGSGLGGGSSDAAQALLAVNSLANGAVPRAELLHMAARLGADIPFFVSDAPLAIAWGHGQRLLRLPALPDRPMLVIAPDVRVATVEAYQWVDEVRQGAGSRGSVTLDPGVLASWSDVARMAGNDFESPIFGRHPPVRAAFEALTGTHPLLCRMTGSGSALFAVYRNERDRDDAALRLGGKHGTVISTTSGGA
ncbi:MAG TPA: 4-(cytidine 5'-diphospho)-2-C-methyl-D-erythritol kinase [Gemmatimonadales bacterium]|jgi:4-diphosphocytidyl-2-C-methyl-D-erythritol kinase|nr:4-(cytidine 5'-diphospho)-2-C-methyl-D-erythritol kinase [Gemmatimonadales bacterium]